MRLGSAAAPPLSAAAVPPLAASMHGRGVVVAAPPTRCPSSPSPPSSPSSPAAGLAHEHFRLVPPFRHRPRRCACACACVACVLCCAVLLPAARPTPLLAATAHNAQRPARAPVTARPGARRPRTGAGTLDKGEAGQAVAHAGYRLDPPSFEALFKSFDPDRWGSGRAGWAVVMPQRGAGAASRAAARAARQAPARRRPAAGCRDHAWLPGLPVLPAGPTRCAWRSSWPCVSFCRYHGGTVMLLIRGPGPWRRCPAPAWASAPPKGTCDVPSPAPAATALLCCRARRAPSMPLTRRAAGASRLTSLSSCERAVGKTLLLCRCPAAPPVFCISASPALQPSRAPPAARIPAQPEMWAVAASVRGVPHLPIPFPTHPLPPQIRSFQRDVTRGARSKPLPLCRL